MASLSAAPLPNQLPAPPSTEFFSEQQWAVLMAIMDAVVPSIEKEGETTAASSLKIPDTLYNGVIDSLKRDPLHQPDSAALDKFLHEKASDIPGLRDLIVRTLGEYTKDEERKLLGLVLSTLGTRVGSLMLTGYVTPIHEQPLPIRTVILKNWSESKLETINLIYKQMTVLAKNVWLKTSQSFFAVTEFPEVPANHQAGSHHEYEFLQFPQGDTPEVIETDVIIVGSGCGGGVCAKNIAEAGHKVLVADKAYYYAPSQLPMTQVEAGVHLFENGGVELSDDSSISIVSGSTWGGGGTVNWSASLQTQGYVRKEWAEDRGLPFFASQEFQNCLDRVCGQMGVSSDHIQHSHRNQVLLEGARRLGYTAKVVPQNTAGGTHHCGYCTLGCASAEKQGPAVAWLPDAAKAGAKFIEGFRVDKVLFEQHGGEKRAVGVEGTWTARASPANPYGPNKGHTRKVIVKAKRVIVSGGTMQSPMLLLRSGLKNHHIGRNLYLHPVNLVGAVYKEDIKPWEGAMLTSVVSSFENLDNHGHGVKLEATCMIPGLCLTFMNWESGLSYKLQALKYRRTNLFIAVDRDRDTGRVYPDARGGCRIEYSPSKFDRAHIMAGVIALCKIAYVSGAEEVHVCITGIKPFYRNLEQDLISPGVPDADAATTDSRFNLWLEGVEKHGNPGVGPGFVSAHQMGTSRMSARPRDGVVDPTGKVWGTSGLYVSDASVFPSASGVNPMVTNMAISDWISHGIVENLGRSEARL